MNAYDLPFPDRILIIKPSSLGDVVSALPVLHALRRTFPYSHIAWMVTPGCAGILEGEADLDERILFDRYRFGNIFRKAAPTRDFWDFCRYLRERKFDWVVDLQGLFRSGFLAYVTSAPVRAGFADSRESARLFYTHTIKPSEPHTIDRNIALARFLGVKVRREDLRLMLPEKIKNFVASFLEQNGLIERRYIVIAHGTRWESKLYPTRHWQKVAKELAGGFPIVLIGSSQETSRSDEIRSALGGLVDMTGKTTPAEAAGIIASSAVVVCCDSAASFIAPALGVPSVTLIGPTRIDKTGPYGDRARAILADVPCQGCLKRTCPHVSVQDGYATCMQLIEPERVIQAVREAVLMRNRAKDTSERSVAS